MKYFVTGATGFIGSRVARRLLAAGHTVTTLASDPAKAGDLAQIAAWYKIGARDSTLADAINVEGTRNVLESMMERGIPKGVYTSTLAVSDDTRGVLVDETYHAAPSAAAR